ncbi:MAG: YdcF family protein [Chloroflexi bacterium]|nr:YdcF family protein [Chloroflexota bacterium]
MKRFALGFCAGIVAALVVLLGIGHVLSPEDPLARADVIVAISGDTGARLDTAIDLWRRGYAPYLLFSGASLDPASAPSSELMQREAVRQGVPGDRVLVETGSTTTEENAVGVAALMRERDLHSAILVTSPYHQRRAALLFSRSFAARELTLRNYPARDPSWDPNLWWLREPSRSLTVVELAKLFVETIGTPLRRGGD